MQKTITASTLEEAKRQIDSLTLPYAYVVKITIEPQEQAKEKQSSETSKWAKMIEEAEEIDISDEIYDHLKACSKEFKEDFYFKHDQD